MKIIIFFIIHVVYIDRGLAKEKTYPVLQDGIISSIQKRLSSPKEGPENGAEANDQCLHRTNYSTIIKTNQSLVDKAVFLKFHKGKEKDDCVQSCCETIGCNLAVYEKKDEHNCYLFDCGSRDHYRCHFAHHEGYVAMTFQGGNHPVKSPSTQGEQDKHENELEGLEVKGAAKPAFVRPTTTTTTAVPTTTTTTHKPTTATPKSVSLYGDCSDGGRCDDENSVCRGGLCICQSGYHAKYGKCHKTHHQDEEKMKPSAVKNNGKYTDDDMQTGDVEKSKEHLPEKTRPQPKLPPQTTTTTTTTTTAMKTTTMTASTTAIKADNGAVKQPTNKPNATSGTSWGRETLHDAVAYFEDSAQGPIVALALGLAFTVILLVFVGCRLRTVKRRIRKGRALHSNEADYLINGMYL